MADVSTKLIDALGATDSYLHALKIMAERVLGEGEDYCAFELILTTAQKEINAAHVIVGEMEGGKC